MAGYHVGLKLGSERGGLDDAVHKNGGLRHFRLREVLHAAVKHEVGQSEPKNRIGLLKHGAVRFEQILSHSGCLGPLARENVGFFHAKNLKRPCGPKVYSP